MKKVRIKNTILANAKSLLQTGGSQQLNIRNIAKKSQCSLGTVYTVFNNYEDIVLHLNAQTLDMLYDKLHRGLDRYLAHPPVSIEGALFEIGQNYIQFSKENINVWKSLFEVIASATLPDWYKQKVCKGFKTIEDKLRASFPMKKETMHKIVSYFWAIIHGISSITLNRKLQVIEDVVDDEYIDTYIKHCLRGIVV